MPVTYVGEPGDGGLAMWTALAELEQRRNPQSVVSIVHFARPRGVEVVGKAEAAAHLHLTVRDLDRRRRNDGLPWSRAGRRVVFDLAELDDWFWDRAIQRAREKGRRIPLIETRPGSSRVAPCR